MSSSIVFKEIAPDAPDEFVPDPKVRREMGISGQTIYRWDRDPSMEGRGWPPRIQFNGRNYRSRHLLEAFKARLAEAGLAHIRKVKPAGARAKKAELHQSHTPEEV